MSVSVDLAGANFDWDLDFANYGHAKPHRQTGEIALISIMKKFLEQVALSAAAIAALNGLAPGAAGNAIVSNGAAWVRSVGSGVTAKFDGLQVATGLTVLAGTTAVQALTATSGLFTAGVTTSTLAVTAANAADGSVGVTGTNGLNLRGTPGSAYDFAVIRPAGAAYILRVPTGTSNVEIVGTLTLGGRVAPTPTAPLGAGIPANGAIYADSATPGQLIFHVGGSRYKLVGIAF